MKTGQTYKLKNGYTFVCDQERPDLHNYPFGGKVYDETGKFDRIAYYARNGAYKLDGRSNYDLQEGQI